LYEEWFVRFRFPGRAFFNSIVMSPLIVPEVVIGIGLLVAALTQGGGAFWDLAKQARLEVYKVVWPSRQETTQTTMIVLLVIFVISLILWLLDMFFGWLASLIIG